MFSQSAERLDVVQNKWETLVDMDFPRSGCCAAVGPDGNFYVMGGLLEHTPMLPVNNYVSSARLILR